MPIQRGHGDTRSFPRVNRLARSNRRDDNETENAGYRDLTGGLSGSYVAFLTWGRDRNTPTSLKTDGFGILYLKRRHFPFTTEESLEGTLNHRFASVACMDIASTLEDPQN